MKSNNARLNPEELSKLQASALKSYEGLKESAIMLSVFTESYMKDPVCLMQLSLSIMLDKPIIFAVKQGTKIPKKLMKIADQIFFYTTPEDLEVNLKPIILKYTN